VVDALMRRWRERRKWRESGGEEGLGQSLIDLLFLNPHRHGHRPTHKHSSRKPTAMSPGSCKAAALGYSALVQRDQLGMPLKRRNGGVICAGK